MKRSLFLLVLAALLTGAAFTTVTAQNRSEIKNGCLQGNLSDRVVQNIMVGLKSDNQGLFRSCVYLIGKYRISKAVPELLSILEKEKNNDNKILIALSLYEIRDYDGIRAIKNLAVNDADSKVRRICSAMYFE